MLHTFSWAKSGRLDINLPTSGAHATASSSAGRNTFESLSCVQSTRRRCRNITNVLPVRKICSAQRDFNSTYHEKIAQKVQVRNCTHLAVDPLSPSGLESLRCSQSSSCGQATHIAEALRSAVAAQQSAASSTPSLGCSMTALASRLQKHVGSVAAAAQVGCAHVRQCGRPAVGSRVGSYRRKKQETKFPS